VNAVFAVIGISGFKDRARRCLNAAIGREACAILPVCCGYAAGIICSG
jgi:hypothetical protein